jgi:hypothetical protein
MAPVHTVERSRSSTGNISRHMRPSYSRLTATDTNSREPAGRVHCTA